MIPENWSLDLAVTVEFLIPLTVMSCPKSLFWVSRHRLSLVCG